jgi:hypothetical protein
MRRTWTAAVLAGLAIVTLTAAADTKGTVVEFDGLKSTAPAAWVEEAPANQMRFMQFKIPKGKDDKADGEIIVFKGLGGSAKDNVARWKAMFVPPEGKGIDDVAKVSEYKVGDATVTSLDVAGTFLYKARPFDAAAKPEKMEGYRMIAVQFDGLEHPYQVRMVGPAKVIDAQAKAFEEFVKGFK